MRVTLAGWGDEEGGGEVAGGRVGEGFGGAVGVVELA
jgi:hypothetical protein